MVCPSVRSRRKSGPTPFLRPSITSSPPNSASAPSFATATTCSFSTTTKAGCKTRFPPSNSARPPCGSVFIRAKLAFIAAPTRWDFSDSFCASGPMAACRCASNQRISCDFAGECKRPNSSTTPGPSRRATSCAAFALGLRTRSTETRVHSASKNSRAWPGCEARRRGDGKSASGCVHARSRAEAARKTGGPRRSPWVVFVPFRRQKAPRWRGWTLAHDAPASRGLRVSACPRVENSKVFAQRPPLLLLRFAGLLLLREAAGRFDALLLNDPPRITRLELPPPPRARPRRQDGLDAPRHVVG